MSTTKTYPRLKLILRKEDEMTEDTHTVNTQEPSKEYIKSHRRSRSSNFNDSSSLNKIPKKNDPTRLVLREDNKKEHPPLKLVIKLPKKEAGPRTSERLAKQRKIIEEELQTQAETRTTHHVNHPRSRKPTSETTTSTCTDTITKQLMPHTTQ